MATVSKTRTYSTGDQLTASNYNDDRDEVIAGVNSINNSQIAADAAIAFSKLASTPATLTGTETLTNKTLTAPTITGTGGATPTTEGRIQFDSTDKKLMYGDGTNAIEVVGVASVVQGDILYHNGTDWTKLSPGDSGKVLQTGGTGANPSWVAAGGQTASCKLTKSAGQTLTSGAEAAVTWDEESWDTDSLHDQSTNTSRITIPSGGAGKWHFLANIVFATNGTNDRTITIAKNGSNVAFVSLKPISTFQTKFQVSYIANASDADYFEANAFQNSGSNFDVEASGSFFECHRLS